MAGADDADNLKRKMMMHVLMVPFPIAGHLNPMLHLSFKLATHGVRVTFVNTEFNRAKVRIPSDHPNINFIHVHDGLPPEHGRTTDLLELCISLDTVYAPNCALLLEKLARGDLPVTCVVCSTVVSHLQEASTRLNLPYVAFWMQSAASYATLMLAKNNKPPEDAIASDAVPSYLLAPGLPPDLKYEDLSLLLLVSQYQTHFISSMLLKPFEHIAEAHCILLNTFEELEEETLAFLKEQGHPILAVGPILPSSYLTQEEEVRRAKVDEDVAVWVASANEDQSSCLEWLDKQEAGSVIYASFGSVVGMSKEQIEEIAVGLEASRQPFLWVVRPGLTANEEFLEGFRERTAGQGLVVSWAPQLSVLRHKAVGGFLTHCGWNSTLEAMSAGVPMLGWPCISDQALNCKFITEKWSTGLKLMETPNMREAEEEEMEDRNNIGLVRREEVEKKVMELMQSPISQGVRMNAGNWRAKAVKSVMERDGFSFINLQHFLDFLTC